VFLKGDELLRSAAKPWKGWQDGKDSELCLDSLRLFISLYILFGYFVCQATLLE
jgi:hypothetical protein